STTLRKTSRSSSRTQSVSARAWVNHSPKASSSASGWRDRIVSGKSLTDRKTPPRRRCISRRSVVLPRPGEASITKVWPKGNSANRRSRRCCWDGQSEVMELLPSREGHQVKVDWNERHALRGPGSRAQRNNPCSRPGTLEGGRAASLVVPLADPGERGVCLDDLAEGRRRCRVGLCYDIRKTPGNTPFLGVNLSTRSA